MGDIFNLNSCNTIFEPFLNGSNWIWGKEVNFGLGSVRKSKERGRWLNLMLCTPIYPDIWFAPRPTSDVDIFVFPADPRHLPAKVFFKIKEIKKICRPRWKLLSGKARPRSVSHLLLLFLNQYMKNILTSKSKTCIRICLAALVSESEEYPF